MRLVARTLGGCVALACAASLSGGTAIPELERAVKPAPDRVDLAALGGPSDVPPEQQSPSDDVRVSVTEIETEVEIFDTSGSLIGESDSTAGLPGVVGSTGIPAMVLAAYQAAAEQLASENAACGLRWQVLAGIGKIESSHARGGQLSAAGVSVPRIIGPVLNGGPGVAAISDSDGGQWDGDVVWDRAVGPMQFIPGTWRGFGTDADGDGVSDPHNVWDATLAAGRYLCAGDGDLRTDSGLRSALYRYNPSASYVNHVLGWINAYLDGDAVPTPDRGPGDADAVPQDNASREPEKPGVPKPDDDGKDDGKDPKDKPPGSNPPDVELVVVPDVVGKTRAEAEAALAKLGLVVDVIKKEVADPAPVGKVQSQKPGASAEVKPGSKVTLTVGVAPPPDLVEVPDLVGMTRTDAEAALTELGLVVKVVKKEVADPAQVGKVQSQSPKALAEVEPGAEVTLTVGVAPPPDLVEVPDLVGMTRAEAEAALTELDLGVEVVEEEVADEAQVGKVLSQSPEALAEVEPGAVVTLTVGVEPPPPEPVVVPDLVGMARADAEAALTDLGLDFVVVEEVVEDEALVGEVLAQDPKASAEVQPGTQVTLTVGAPPPPPGMPAVVDMTLADAKAALTDLDLDLEIVIVKEEVDDDTLVDQVLAQKPQAQTEVEPGSEVTLTVGVAP